MSGWSRTLQCSIKSRDGGDIQRTAEIKGEGKDYLKCLSESLSTMQSDVNALLTGMVEKEKAQAAKSNARAEGSSGSEDMDGDDDDDDSDIMPRQKRPKR